MNSISEQAFFFPNRNQKSLFGFYHRPSTKTDKKVGILICNPIFEERIFAYRFLVNFAREACIKGYHVLRFDYYGYGDSQGDVAEATVSSMLADIEDAYIFFEKNNAISNIFLLGFRFGATLSCLFCRNFKRIAAPGLILWEPIFEVMEYINKALRQAVSLQTILFKKIIYDRKAIISNILKNKQILVKGYNLASVDGYPLTKELFQEFSDIKINDIIETSNEKLIIFLKKPRQKPDKEKTKLIDQFTQCENVRLMFNIIEEPVEFWRDNKLFKNVSEQTFDITLQWIEKN